jgi:polygalacturonase
MKSLPGLWFVLAVSLLPRSAWAEDPAAATRDSGGACDARAFGAKGDGKTKDTGSIQAAIDACARTGGVVSLRDGVFLSGMIVLKTGIVLRIEPSATLKGSQDDADYPDTNPPTRNSQLSNCRKALVYAEHADHIAIEGGGTIDGSGDNPRWNGKENTRPMAIFIALSDDVAIHDISVKNSGMWSVVNMETDNLVIRKLDVRSPFGPTRDGIDIVDCHHVLVEDSQIFSEDDAICLKSGSARGVYDVTVRNCRVLQSSVANGLKLGTASTGSFRKVLFEDISIENVDKAAMAVESVDGADIDDVRFVNIKFHRAGSAIFVLLGRRGSPAKVGSIQNISFMNVDGDTRHAWGSAISGTDLDGTTYSPRNLAFDNVHVNAQGGLKAVPAGPAEYHGQYPDPNLWGDLPAFGYYLRHVDGASFRDSTIEARPGDAREAIVRVDVSGFSSR